MTNKFNTSLLVNKIESLCHEAGITKTKMLVDCGLSKSIMNNLKSGSIPSVDKIAIIADYFHVSVDYLLGREESPQQGNNIQTGDIQGSITGNNNLSIATAPPPQPPTDSVTDEFFKVFQELSFPDKLYVMNCAMEKVKKGA